MSDVALEGFGSGGGGLSMELLWENGAGNSSFIGSNTITLPKKYNNYLLEYYGSGVNSASLWMIIGQGKATNMYVIAAASAKAYIGVRKILITDTTVTFNNAEYGQAGGTLSENNAVCVPQKIYGIEGVPA